MSEKLHGNSLPLSRSEAKLYASILSEMILPVTSESFPCHKSISLYLQQRSKISCINPLDVPRKNFFLCKIIFADISRFLFSTSYFFQKYLSLSKSNRLENGATPENSLTIAEDVDFGAPKRFFQCLCLKMFKLLNKATYFV